MGQYGIFRVRAPSLTLDWSAALSIDEELTLLEDQLRRLKVEYDIYFGGGSKKPPADIEWKVKTLLKKYTDGQRMNYAQRFRYTTIQQRFALYNALWQQKLIIKEEGYRRPQDAVDQPEAIRHRGVQPGEQHRGDHEVGEPRHLTCSADWARCRPPWRCSAGR